MKGVAGVYKYACRGAHCASAVWMYAENYNLELQKNIHYNINVIINAMKRKEKICIFQRCGGWCEAQDAVFLLTPEQSFRNLAVCGSSHGSRKERSAAVIGIEWRACAI